MKILDILIPCDIYVKILLFNTLSHKYVVIHRQIVSSYYNSVVWLDTFSKLE